MPISHRETGSVLTLSQDDHPAMASTLERELIKAREEQIQGMVSSKDWPDFTARRGTVIGLETAISICKKVNDRLGK